MEVYTNPSLIVEPIIFKKADWTFRYKANGTVDPIGIPNTWCEPTEHLKQAQIMALFCCPNCKRISAIVQWLHEVNRFGKVSPSLQCMNPKRCSFHRNAYLDMWNNKPLYACAVERVLRDGTLKAEIHHMHANNVTEARIHLGPGNYHIVGIARAIGFFVEDKHGEKLSADAPTVRLK
jgi:hypothetical protein